MAAKIHDRFVVELAEVIKGYGNNPDVDDPFRLSAFYRFYELPNIAVSRENFEKMSPLADVAPVRHGEWINEGIYGDGHSQCSIRCSECDWHYIGYPGDYNYCPNCGADLREEETDGQNH